MKILPKPYSIERKDGSTVFSKSTQIDCPLRIVAQELLFLDYDEGESNLLSFVKGKTDYDYELVIDGNMKVLSMTDEGLFHGAMTLKQLLFDGYENGVSVVDNCVIKDKPRFEYRGFMLDIVRHYFDKEVIKGLIDTIALAKINKLHLHLSDNQGYRLESTVYPQLNIRGSVRKGTRGDGVPVGGYLTKEDVREIVAYASERYVEIIPEIDLPGHTVAILSALPSLGCFEDSYEPAERYGIDERIICAGKESTYEVIENLLAEVTELFPSKYFHIGGDEVPKTHWETCPDCQGKMKEQGLKNVESLQGYFTNRVIGILQKYGKTAVVWNESLYSGMLDESAVCQYWQDGKGAKRVVTAASKGRKTIVSRFGNYYIDYPHGLTPLKKTYGFDPLCEFVDGKENVLGVETPLWTEWVADVKKVYTQAFPRVFAVAESGWSDGKKNYADFADRLDNLLGIMMAYERDFTTEKDANPNPFARTLQVIRFFANMIDVDAIRSTINATKAKKGRKNN